MATSSVSTCGEIESGDELSRLRQLCRAGELSQVRQFERELLRTLVCARDGRTGYTTLHSAALFHRPHILRMLLESGGAPDIAGYHDGQCPLHKVARYPGDERQIECVKLLLRAGAQIDQQDIRGNTDKGCGKESLT